MAQLFESEVHCAFSSFYFLKMLRHSFDLINISQIIHLGSGSQLSHDYGRGRGLSTVFRIGLASITSERLWLLAYDYGWLQQKTFSSKSQVININSINLFLLIPYHFQISLSSPTATSRLHKLINFLGSARRINRLLLVTTNRQKTGPQKKMAATMKRAGKATIDCHFRLRLAGSFFPAQPCDVCLRSMYAGFYFPGN